MSEFDITCPFCDHTDSFNSFNVYDNVAFCNNCSEAFPVEKEKKVSTIKGGKHIGKVRSWIQWNAINGSEVTWGSHEPLRFSKQITPAMLERLAQDIREASMDDIRSEVESIQRIFNRMLTQEDEASRDWDQRMVQGGLKKLLEKLEGF